MQQPAHRFSALMVILTVIAFPFFSKTYAQSVIPLLSNWDDPAVMYYSDCWGYAAPDGREYAMIGSSKGVHFIDVTDPYSPVVVGLGVGAHAPASGPKDITTYQHYCYVSSAGGENLQIYDLQYLPDSVHKVYDTDTISGGSHTLFISGDKLFLASNYVNNHSVLNQLDVFSLADPVHPAFISTLSGTYDQVHEVFVRNDTAYVSCGFDGMYIYDYTNPASPQLIQSITSYAEQGYNHDSWTTPDGKIIVWTDEDQGKGVKLYDFSDLANPVPMSLFRSNLLNAVPANGANGSTAHQPIIVNNKVVLSYYNDGVQIFDISDPYNPVQEAYYDTSPLDTSYANMSGCWGTYPFLPSGHIIASDMKNGLFILDGTLLLGTNELSKNSFMNVYPNPFSASTTIETGQELLNKNAKLVIEDLSGRIVKMEIISSSRFVLQRGELVSGMYICKVMLNGEVIASKKIICQ